MSGGPPNSSDPGQHVWLRSGSIVTPEEYRRNQQQLMQYRDTLARMEQENEQAYMRYTMAEQELQNRVAQGREAELMLANIRSRPHPQINSTPLLTMASSAANDTSSTYSPAPTHTPAYGSRAANGHDGEFVQGNSRAASGATQPHAYAPYYNPSSTQYARPPPPPYNIQHQAAQQHQAHSSASYDPHRYAATQQSSPYSAAAPANHSQYDPSQYPPQQYQAHYPQGYSAAAAPAGPPTASTSRNDEARRQGSNQTAPSAERPASKHDARPGSARGLTSSKTGRSSTGSNKQPPHQVSASVQSSNEGQSQEARKAIMEELQKRAVAAEGRIHGIVHALPGQTAMVIFRVVVDKLKHKMKKTDGSSAALPSIELVKNSITPQMDHVSDLVVAELQNLPGSLIITTLRKVQARIAQKTNSTKPPVTVAVQQSISVVNAPPAQNAEPPVPPVPLESQAQPRQAYAIRLPQVNWPSHAQPSHQPRPPHEDLQVRQWLPNGTPGPEVSEPSHTNSAPSISFSNLPPSTPRTPQTPQPNVVGPTFTPGRLAHDILRSLGRPTGQTAAGISSPAPSEARGDGNQTNGKRKRSISAEEANDKRRKPSSDAAADSTTSQNTGNSQMLAGPSAPPVSIDASKLPEAGILHQELSVSQDEGMAVVEEPEEIHTPGVIESALNEAAAALRRSHTSTHVQQPSSPMRDAPPVQNGLIPSSSPGPPSAASPPPSSKVTTPEPEVPPQLDGNTEMAVLATPVAGPSKQPLFYVSPTASPDEEHPRPHFDDAMSEFVPSGLLTGSAPTSPRKGKERAREDDAEVEIVEAALTNGDPGDTDSDVIVVDTSEPDEAVLMVKTKRKAPSITRLQRVYVLVPPPSKALQKLRREHHSQKPRGGARIVGRAVVSSDEDSDVDEIAEDFRDEATQVKEAAEARVVQDLCYTRLKPYQCRWSNCDAVLESAKRLGVHAGTHAFDLADDPNVYVCSWEGCPREYKSKERLAHHVRKHSLHPVACAYAGCDFECWAARDMVMHHNQPKHRGQPLKPEARPVEPDLSVELPPLPQTLPSYMSISRPIRAARISEERHAKLAPRIAANLSTWTPLGEASDSTSLRTPRRPKLSEKLVASLESGEGRDVGLWKTKSPVRGAYDYWLEARALRRVRRLCDDMPSRAVTDMFAKGLIIDNDWLARGEPEWELHEQDADSVTDCGDDELRFFEEAKQPEAADGGMRDTGPAGDAGDGVSAVVAEAEELHALHTLADGPSQQPSWEVLPDASETE